MSSLDDQLASLQRPIPKGVDLSWTETGETFTPSDENNPNAQAANIMNQLIFNRTIQRVAKKDLMPEERAVAQTVVSHMQAGNQGMELYSSLAAVFGQETFQRHAGLIQAVESAIQNNAVVSSDVVPSVGVNVAMNTSNPSDRNEAKQYETQRTSSSLESYRNDDKPMEDGSISLGQSEMDINIASAGPGADVQVSEGKLDEINLPSTPIMTGSIDEGETAHLDQLNDDLFSSNDVGVLDYVASEQALLDEESSSSDIEFNSDLMHVGNVDMDLENALMGCDEDLRGLTAQTPPIDLLEGDESATQCFADENGNSEDDASKNLIQLDEIKQASDIGVTLSNDFEIEM
jgi:hypothetical protein